MEPQFIFCLGDGCTNKVKDDRWSKLKALGWYFSKTGAAYCPEHLPEWVETWRLKKAEANE